MKKSFLLIAPMVLMLTACGGSSFKIDLLNGVSHEPGFENGGSSYKYSSVPYSYRPNSSFETAGLTKATITFKDIEVSDSDVVNPQTIKSYINVDQQDFDFEIAENIKHFGTKKEGLVFLGNEYNDEYGQFTFVTSKSIKNVVITCKPYSYLKTAFNENTLIIDEDVAVAVNDIGFIKLNKPILNDDHDEIINQTECAFFIEEPTGQITIKAGRKRVILQEISFYY